MKKAFLLATFVPLLCTAQSVLKPSIGLGSLPADNTPICSIPVYTGSFDNSGLHAGDTAYDFKLYSLSGDSFVLSEKLSHHKPVLLVAGSYTCPVFRNKLAVLNSVAAAYAGQIEIAIIYGVEAHPTNVSPYFGYVNVTQQNQNAGILYAQPVSYGERKNICNNLLQSTTVNVPVYLDGPCNEWWNTYGPAPNNAYLIDTNGIVFAKHGWFDRHPDHDIACDIDSLLGMGSCTPATANGSFILQPVSPTVSGLPGEVLYAHVNVINTTAGYVDIGVKRMQPNLPAGWETAFCFQVCFSPTEDSITIQVAPYDTADFSFDFFTTSPTPDSGSMKVGFRNVNDITNGYSLTFRAFTVEAPIAIDDITGESAFSVFPNPAAGNLLLRVNESCIGETVSVFDINGKLLHTQPITSPVTALSVAAFAPGVYYISAGGEIRKWVKQ